MDRRKFLSWFPKMAGVSAVALVAPAGLDKLEIAKTEPPKVEVLPPEDRPLTESEMIYLANAAAICYGLRPAPSMSFRCDIMDADKKRVGELYDNTNGVPELMEGEDA